jgi:hypothetical protein
MREEVLRQFFEGELTARELAQDVVGSIKKASSKGSTVSVENMDRDLKVTTEMARRLCDAVLSGELPADDLHTIGFALQASEKFYWDGDEDEVLAEVLADWSCPEVNYPLTVENVRRFKNWLTRAEPYPAKPPIARTRGRIISVIKKEAI